MVEQQPACDPAFDQDQAAPVDLGQAEPDQCEPEGCPFCGFCEIDQAVRRI